MKNIFIILFLIPCYLSAQDAQLEKYIDSLMGNVNRLDMLGMSEMWVGSRPRLTEWFERMKSRPSFKPSLLDMCPPDLTDDLKTFGTRSWPDVKRLVAA